MIDTERRWLTRISALSRHGQSAECLLCATCGHSITNHNANIGIAHLGAVLRGTDGANGSREARQILILRQSGSTISASRPPLEITGNYGDSALNKSAGHMMMAIGAIRPTKARQLNALSL
jgi:hypothetical protein